MKENFIILNVEKVWLGRYYIWFGDEFLKDHFNYNYNTANELV